MKKNSVAENSTGSQNHVSRPPQFTEILPPRSSSLSESPAKKKMMDEGENRERKRGNTKVFLRAKNQTSAPQNR